MDAIGAFEAKTNLAKLLDRVESGETVIITRHGRPVAQLAPVPDDDRKRARSRAAMKALLDNARGLRLDSLSWKDLRDEGRDR